MHDPTNPATAHTLTLSFPFDLYERIKALKLDPGKGFAPQLVERAELLADFQADYRKVMSGQCAPDERHCSCVPHLRARIAELERERVDLINGADLAADRANRHRQERDAARAEIGHLQDELIKLREGAPTPPAMPTIPAARCRVLTDVHDERERQDAKFGRDRDHALTYGGFEGRPTDLCAAYGLPTADAAKARCDAAMKVGRVTYGHILVEEVCEFFEAAAGGDMVAVRKELVQVVAVGVAMVEALDRAAERLAQADAREAVR